ncbi:MAG: dihydroorotate dehydrogenase electron transfer subunit [Candidatus Altiarchaeales archaeon]|nr:dihydroorotate dehydrogenase electron transfer subunit [Candidatus Altiarchaeales archaeon]
MEGRREKPRMVEIKKTIDETPIHKTLTLGVDGPAEAGQYCMLWMPGVGEKPFSFSAVDGELKVTVKKVGDFTEKLFELREGAEIGFRGPYGHGFKETEGKCLIVGGGCGIAPLKPLSNILEAEIILSAKCGREILFEETLKKRCDVAVCTDDGSQGEKAFAHQMVRKRLKDRGYACVYACGPERMLKKIADICEDKNTACQVSLERYIKCGLGLCASCMIGQHRVCVDGPVFYANRLRETEFGRYTRNASSRKVMLDEGC